MNHRAHLHSIHLPISEIGTPYLWFDSLSGTESINDLFHYQLIVKTKDALGRPAHGIVGLDGYVNADHYHQTLTQADPLSQQTAAVSPASHLDMQTLVGTTIGISIDLNDIQPLDNQTITGTCYKHALIIAISQRTTHNLHAVYELTLAPWLYLLTQTNNYRIYQNQSIPYILEDILSHYPYPVEYRLNHHYDTLDYQTQYNESDYAFITRLMSEHGINFYFEHQKDNHILIITDHNSHFTPQDNPFYQTLTIYPPNQRMPEYAEYLEHFIPTQQLTPGQLLVSDYQFKTPSTPIITHDTHPWHTANNHLQQYHWQQGRRVNQSGLQTLTNTLMQQQHQQGLRAKGQGHLKGLQVGHYFTLTNHPNQDSNIQWLILSISITIENLNPDNRTHQYYTANTTFSAQPLKEPLTPDVIHPKPIAYTQTATVVVPEGEEIHTDQYGRIKVKFHWDRPSNEQRHILAQPDSTIINTCWLRVAKPWSGNHYGTINLPRKDQEVIIDFFGGNPDMPYISGTLNNPEHMPLYTLPDGQVLSGIKSKEYQGSQSNQLIMDDTPGKLQLQLKSDHLHSELNLGHIRRITPIQGRQEYRGEGFELRSDGHGVLRADKGMVISTHGRQ
ncbi:type VI secretion system Vgr family protein, partial [Moraxella porci]|uniref:type VI secretion system Vgr family protein n=1 Tax=Moraxella porci TaxID=1288392 RepID=UPI002448DA07